MQISGEDKCYIKRVTMFGKSSLNKLSLITGCSLFVSKIVDLEDINKGNGQEDWKRNEGFPFRPLFKLLYAS